METFAERIARSLSGGHYKEKIKQHCLRWREHPTDYVLTYIIPHLIDAGDSFNLYQTLVDEEFRRAKRERIGLNALRLDYQRGTGYFSHNHIDEVRYLQLLFHGQRCDPTSTKLLLEHEKICREFTDFIQLDTPARLRKQVGLHRVIKSTFPLKLRTKFDGVRRAFTVELKSYEVGDWYCKCGTLEGQQKRYEYKCGCGETHGQNAMDGGVTCEHCGQVPDYVRCALCGTRVTLDLIWKLLEGNLHPSELILPVTLSLIAKVGEDVFHEFQLEVLKLPILLGIREQKGRIDFDLPALMWLDKRNPEDASTHRFGGYFYKIVNNAEFQGRTGLVEVLESIITNLLTQGPPDRSLVQPYKRDRVKLKATLKSVLNEGLKKAFMPSLSEGLIGHLTRYVASANMTPVGVSGEMAFPFESKVAMSPLLTQKESYINVDLINPEGLSSSYLINQVVRLKSAPFGQETLTQMPCGNNHPSLEDDGIIRAGTIVNPGDVLVGVETAARDSELSSEDKILSAIFGVKQDKFDTSFKYRGDTPGRVISVNVDTSPAWGGSDVKEKPGRTVHRRWSFIRDYRESLRITISIAIQRGVEIGDTLYSHDGNSAVICSKLKGAQLRKLGGWLTAPDLVVAPDHPWAPGEGIDPSHNPVLIGLKDDIPIGHYVRSRSWGDNKLVDLQPIEWQHNPNPAQVFDHKDFDWLLACGAFKVALELYGPRCDCPQWASALFDEVVSKESRLNSYPDSERSVPADLADSPYGTMQAFALFLKGLDIGTAISMVPRPELKFYLMDKETLLKESFGEVTSPFTIAFPDLKPDKGGLCCERIFGPTESWRCSCGKLKGARLKGKRCQKCGVEIAHRRVRLNRSGHINLAAPVVNPLYLRAVCEYLAPILGLRVEDLIGVIEYEKCLTITTNNGETGIVIDGIEEFAPTPRAHLEGEQHVLRCQGGLTVLRLLEYVESEMNIVPDAGWRRSVIESILVVPPERRPTIVGKDSSKIYFSDLNSLYKAVILSNDSLRKLIRLRAPGLVLTSGTLSLQRNVHRLFDNKHYDHPAVDDGRPFKALTDHLMDFTEDAPTLLDGFLHRPVDYSARTRVVVGETGDIDTALLPECLAWDLFRLMLLRRLRPSYSLLRFASEEINQRSDRAREALHELSLKTIILAAFDFTRHRVVALRPILTGERALIVNRDLLNYIGWENLGRRVRLFSVLSTEAEQEGINKLLPSRLKENAPTVEALRKLNQHKRSSVFFIKRQHLVSELARRAVNEESFRLGIYDLFTIGKRVKLPGVEA